VSKCIQHLPTGTQLIPGRIIMSSNSIATKNKSYQPSRDGQVINFNTRSQRSFLKDLINENAEYQDGGYQLWVQDLSFIEKKYFLAQIVDAFEYGWLCEDTTRLEAGIEEYKNYMQKLIDYNIDEIYEEIMEKRYE
jgi:hypothetical protein